MRSFASPIPRRALRWSRTARGCPRISMWTMQKTSTLHSRRGGVARRSRARAFSRAPLRTSSMHITSFFTLCLSALALRSGVAVEFWGILRHLGLVREKKWIKGFRVKIAEALRLKATGGNDVSGLPF